MRTICLVNNFNYARYLADCLQSVSQQTVQFDQIIIVDDGSVDDSPHLIQNFCNQHAHATCLLKNNAGQLSCFNVCTPWIDAEDLIFFIDSDDIYPFDYLENVLKRRDTDCDLLFSNAVIFDDAFEKPLETSLLNHLPSITIHKTTALTRVTRKWVGSPTSAIVVTGKLFLNLLPYPHIADWKTRADDVFVYGAALFGAKKCYMQSLGIGYRLHSRNAMLVHKNIEFLPNNLTHEQVNAHNVVLDRLFQYFSTKFKLNAHSILCYALFEYIHLNKYSRSTYYPAFQRIMIKKMWKAVLNRLHVK